MLINNKNSNLLVCVYICIGPYLNIFYSSSTFALTSLIGQTPGAIRFFNFFSIVGSFDFFLMFVDNFFGANLGKNLVEMNHNLHHRRYTFSLL